ncbi:MAG: glycosyltransferase family 2 protein, partial [Lachnospiraceae bacterium]|nr:glycosyltransferase family 2 protein [Lachnospiraceae bacterium]
MGELVSIIVPMYNAEKFILETIASVEQQSYEDWNLILVDDGSTDDTCQVVEKHIEDLTPEVGEKILLLHNRGKGAWSARNTGLAAAESRYIAFLDADDVWKPEKLEREVSFAQEHQAGFVFTGYEFADENAKGLGKVVKVPKTITYKQALSNTT